MKVGIFSDLHSNIYALQHMMEMEADIEQWICLGDFVGLFPAVNEVVDAIKQHAILAIKGDHEEYLLNNQKMEYSVTGNDSIEKQRNVITPENKVYIAHLKDTHSFYLDRLKCFMTHSLHSSHAKERNQRYTFDLQLINNRYKEYDVVLFGDTHLPLLTYCKSLILINPGSSGFPIDKMKKPSYVIFNTQDSTCQFKRIEFDKQKLLQDILIHGYHQKLYNFVNNGFCWS
jgi:putative phosphoesterase